ncbi:glycosyltransferase [Dysgonomonas sp. Marseille-P4677]|nr:glycosyltransferase [Dysgonomonas sp. Marseille-P4677]
MNNPKISIIVPVHNAGEYLDKCLTSLVMQTLEDIEIILILDRPTDGSEKVAEIFAAKDNRIKLIYNEENLHTGLSRNKGLKIATGKYIGFHDHDDYSEPTMYELLYKKAEEHNFDVVRCNFSCIYNKNNTIINEEYKYPDMSVDPSNKEWIYENVGNDTISCVIWNHIYRADFLAQHNIEFLDSRTICSEDSIFFIEVYKNLDRLGIVPKYLYYHVFHMNNTGKVYNYRSIKNRIAFFDELYLFMRKNNISEKQSRSFISKNIASSLYSGSRQALLLFPRKKAIEEIQYIRQNRLMMECIKNLYKKENLSILFSLKPTIIIFLFILNLFGKKQKSS